MIAAATATAVVTGALATGILPSPFSAGTAAAKAAAAADRPSGCSVGTLTGDWQVGTLHLDVRDTTTGRELGGVRGDEPAATGSTMKVVTMAAAVAALGPSTTIETKVVAAGTPGTVILVGGGDPTLSRLPSGQSGVYPDAPHLDALAAQVRHAMASDPSLAGSEVTRVQVDASLFSGPAWPDGWSASARTSGSVSNITALMVDGDRDDPTREYSKRSDGAVMRAAQAFATEFGPGVSVDPDLVQAPSGATVLGSVHSAPVAELARYTLTHSDDTLAETLGRLVAVKEGAGSTFAAIQRGSTGALAPLGIPTTGLTLADASGLSNVDRVPASYLTTLMVHVARRENGLAPVYDGLAVAGRTGTLAEDGRFQARNQAAAGHIRGKTGTLDDMHGLTGIAEPASGHPIAFTIWAESVRPGTDPGTARNAIDSLAANLYRCGDSISR